MANPSETSHSTDVLIVGAGPSGLMMACQLAIHQIPFRILDKKELPANYSGALIVHARSLELFRQLGIAETAVQKGIIANEIQIVFNGNKSFVIPVGNMGSGLSPFPYLLLLEQSKTESLLIQFLQERGVQVERKTELLQINQNSHEVLSILKPENGREETVKSKYLIGADGAHSTVRKQLQIPFEGQTHAVSLFVSDCDAETEFPPGRICFSFSDKTTAGFFPLPDGKWRIDGTISGETYANLTFADLTGNFGEQTRMPVRLHDPHWFSVFQTNQRIVPEYRQNRCFLVGDAAHIHSPVGAQGMNTGLQDAHNLAWKLALVIQQKADEKLLETYHSERIGVARSIVRYTDWVFGLVTNPDFLIRNFRMRVLPFLLKLFYPALTKNLGLRRSFFRRISGIAVHYRKSPLSGKASCGKFPPHAPKPGDRLPFLKYAESGQERNIQDKITGTGFHLLIFSSEIIPEEIKFFAKKYAHIMAVEPIFYSPETKSVFKQLGIRNSGFYLIRPDGYLAFRSAKPEIKDLENYLKKLGIQSI